MATLNFSGKTPVIRDWLIRMVKGRAIESRINFSNFIVISSLPLLVFGFDFRDTVFCPLKIFAKTQTFKEVLDRAPECPKNKAHIVPVNIQLPRLIAGVDHRDDNEAN